MCTMQTVQFHADELQAWQDDQTGKTYAGLRQRCRNIGMAYACSSRNAQEIPPMTTP